MAAKLTASALAADANAFAYDEVFEDIQNSRGAQREKADADRVERKSRYIEDLIAKAAARKQESDVSYERRLLKERLKEDHLYADKDKFVTAAYRAKLQEDAKWLAEDKVRDELEQEEDVAKRGDMTAFYSNLMSRDSTRGGDMAKQARRATPELSAASAPKLTTAADRDREIIARASKNETQAPAASPPQLPPVAADVTLVENLKTTCNQIETPAVPAPKLDAKRNCEAAVNDARARYLERKRKAASTTTE
jgi:coiled-coil domain-containing protein 55